jgi:hypothetical protein
MTLSGVNDVKHWRDPAAEMRILSTMMEHVETRGQLDLQPHVQVASLVQF